ncbi:MAG TPA: hypothetical protein PLW31_15055 [Bacteroidales bacterium]|nr:hypothetical protein [Bacteroidales bacterium]
MKYLIIITWIFLSMVSAAQPGIPPRCPNKAIQFPDSRVVKEAQDFTIITTDGVTRNLYNTLDSGKTVFIDIFYTTCYYCQVYAPVIEEIYQNTGAGEGDIEFWGISNNLFDTNNVIDEYREQYNITNPCAGPWGDGEIAFTILVNGQNFNGFPTYCVICPDRTLYFDACYPPTTTCFDPFFEQCASIGINDDIIADLQSKHKGPVTVEVYDLVGRKIFSGNFESEPDLKSISSSVQDNRMYVIRILNDNRLIDIHKIVITGR